MEWLYHVDLEALFVPKESVLQMVIRGTLMYLAAFSLLRMFRRQAGGLGIADLLVLVLIADAGSNGLTGDGYSVTEALVVISTIVLWDWTLDWFGFKSRFAAALFDPKPLLLVKDGKLLRQNMKKEMITEEELLSQLRLQGVENIDDVKECRLESNGEFSVLRASGEPNPGNNKKKTGVK